MNPRLHRSSRWTYRGRPGSAPDVRKSSAIARLQRLIKHRIRHRPGQTAIRRLGSRFLVRD
jgi:hypothetical protein